MFNIMAVGASVAALALAATLVVPQGAGEPDSVPGASGPTHRVATDGSGDYQTINEALAAAEEGDTILVAPGTYSEYLFIEKDITLAGDGPREDIVVEFPEGGPARVFEADEGPYSVSYAVVLQGSDATLRSLTIWVPPDGVGVLVDGGGPELVDLSVVPHPDVQLSGDRSDPDFGAFEFSNGSSPFLRGSSWTGRLFSGQSSPTIEDSIITAGRMPMDGPGEVAVRGNTFLDGGWLHLDFDLTGIIEGNDLSNGSIGIGDGSSMTVKGNVLRNTGSGREAIVVGRDSRALIVGNTVADYPRGIHVDLGALVTIEGNDLTGNDVAIRWESTETGAIDGNTVRGGETGIEIPLGDPSVVDNTVEGASLQGIYVGAGTPTIDGNRVCGSEANLVIGTLADPVIGDNEICPDEVGPAE
jgi:hypothetical protein